MAHAHEGREGEGKDVRLTSFPHPLGRKDVSYWVLSDGIQSTWFRMETDSRGEESWEEI
jgi:hypothetical protein